MTGTANEASRSVTELLQDSVHWIRARTAFRPKVGFVLGSGLGAFVEAIKVEHEFPYRDIPGFLPTSIEGHRGQLILGYAEGVPIVCLQGRVHYYEGHSMSAVVHPVRTAALLGTESMVLTNSAGGLDSAMVPGDFMVVEDHINMMGDNPLRGPNSTALGLRFPDMSEAYDFTLRQRLIDAFEATGVKHFRGIYCAVSGPSYETPAEVRFLQSLGGAAVGMSTVPEVIAANHMGLKICALSCITNAAAGLTRQKLSHAEVTETAQRVAERLQQVLLRFLKSP